MRLRIDNPPTSYLDALNHIASETIIPRIWARDYTVWSSEPKEIVNRLGWVDLPTTMSSQIQRIEELVDSVLKDGYTHTVLLGMGGSSLAPDMLSRIFGTQQTGYLTLRVLD